MRRFWTHLLPLLLPACVVNTPVVEGNSHQDLAAWCKSACSRVYDCDPANRPEPCVDDCDSPAGPNPCFAECFSVFDETFVGKNEICSASLGRIQDCVDEASCADLRFDGACNLDAEAERCLASQGLVKCTSSGDGDTGGTGGSAGYAGSAGVLCEAALHDCTNESSYRMTCTSSEPPVCSCLENEEQMRSFVLNGIECPRMPEAVELCGWPIVDVADDPTAKGVFCRGLASTGAAGAGSVGECSVSFGQCSNGHEYGLECGGSAGEGTCACTIGGTTVRLFELANLTCGYLTEVDGALLTVKENCGFEITML